MLKCLLHVCVCFCVPVLKSCNHTTSMNQSAPKEPLRKMESHAHKGTARAIVSIGAGHGNNVINRIQRCVLLFHCLSTCAHFTARTLLLLFKY